MSRITKSKFYKPLISLLVAVMLVFSFEVNKPKAIVPLLVPLGYLVAGVVAETMLEMGIKHVTSSGKTSKGTKGQKIADAVLGNLGDYDFDNTNPTRKADGSLEMNMSPNDRAKIARKIADEFDDVIDMELARKSSTQVIDGKTIKVVAKDSTQPSLKAYDYVLKMHDISDKDYDSGRDVVEMYSVITGEFVGDVLVDKNSVNTWQAGGFSYDAISAGLITEYDDCIQIYNYKDPATTGGQFMQAWCDPKTINAYLKSIKVKTDYGEDVHYGGGLAVPSTLKKVYSVGEDIADDYLLPNNQDLSNKPYKVKNIFPPSTNDEDVTWEVVQNHYDNDLTVKTKFEDEVGVYLENGDINNTTNTYNTQTINNYYTDTTYPVKNADIINDIDIVIDNEDTVIVDDGDDDGTGTTPKPAEVLDRTLISYAKQTYDYLGDSIDGAITSMRDITDDASGLVDYLDTSFRWLPAEWRALFGSAFILGVFAHFMRR